MGQTDGRTDTGRQLVPRLCIASRGKKKLWVHECVEYHYSWWQISRRIRKHLINLYCFWPTTAGDILEAAAVARVWNLLHNLRSAVRVSTGNTGTGSTGHRRAGGAAEASHWQQAQVSGCTNGRSSSSSSSSFICSLNTSSRRNKAGQKGTTCSNICC